MSTAGPQGGPQASWGANPPPGAAGGPQAQQAHQPTDDKAKQASAAKRGGRTVMLLGFVLAVGAAMLVVLATADDEERIWVAEADTPMPAGETVDLGRIAEVERSADTVPEGAVQAESEEELGALIEDELDLGNVVTRQTIPEGAVLYEQYFAQDIEGVTDLGDDERLLTIEANAARAVAGQLAVGDHVDVVAVQDEQLVSRVLSDVEILSMTVDSGQLDAASQDIAGAEEDLNRQDVLPSEPIPGLYTIKVDVEELTETVATDYGADLYLAYRGVDADDGDVLPASLLETLCDVDGLDVGVDAEVGDLPGICQDVVGGDGAPEEDS